MLTPSLRSYAWNIVQIKSRELKGGETYVYYGETKKNREFGVGFQAWPPLVLEPQ